MNVDELYRLGGWYAHQFSELNTLYGALLEPINHNANQSDKRPVESELNALTGFLADQHFDELSLEQLKMLSSLGVDVYIGPEGAAYVEAAVRTSNYDPATAVQRLNAAVQSINSTRGLLAAYVEAVNNLGFGPDDVLAEDGLITIRVGFQNDVAINNVTEWKDTAKEWYDIVRGLSMACDESPEDVKVIGAATGSLILILAGTAAFTALLAQISKHITTAAKDIIGVRMEVENLRQKKLLTKGMEAELKKIEKEKTDGAITTIEKLLEGKVKVQVGDVSVALTSSIKKLLTFSEKGGTVDFVAPEDEAEPEDGDAKDGGLKAALIEAKNLTQKALALGLVV
jgi:hypothetical protein